MSPIPSTSPIDNPSAGMSDEEELRRWAGSAGLGEVLVEMDNPDLTDEDRSLILGN